MSDAASNRQNRSAEGRWLPGQSGNPGGMPKGLRDLQTKILLTHGPKVLEALQRLFEMGMDERHYIKQDRHGEDVKVPLVEAAVRVKALDVFSERVGNLTGLASIAKARDDDSVDDAKMSDAEFWARVLSSPTVRETVRSALVVLDGGKK